MRLGFKEILFRDIKNVFMNPAEFGETHIVNGKRMVIIIDGNEVVERAKKQSEQGRIDGVFQSQVIIYVAGSDFGKLPAIKQVLTLDGNTYRVTDAINEGGIYSITLNAYKS